MDSIGEIIDIGEKRKKRYRASQLPLLGWLHRALNEPFVIDAATDARVHTKDDSRGKLLIWENRTENG